MVQAMSRGNVVRRRMGRGLDVSSAEVLAAASATAREGFEAAVGIPPARGTRGDLTGSTPYPDGLTCERFDIALKAGHQLLRTLQVVQHDLHLLSGRNRRRMLFALDFSDIHAYIWPETSRSIDRQVVRQALHSRNLEFTLPPGTTGFQGHNT